MKAHKYGMRLRGVSPGCQPPGFLGWKDGGGRYHNFIFYAKKLPQKYEHYYDLDYIGEEDFDDDTGSEILPGDMRRD